MGWATTSTGPAQTCTTCWVQLPGFDVSENYAQEFVVTVQAEYAKNP